MTEFEGPLECPCYTVPDQCNVGRLTDTTLNLTRPIGLVKRSPWMESVWHRFWRITRGVSDGYGGKTMETTQTDELD